MPQANAYTIYTAPTAPRGWVVRVYRDSDDTHIHSAENVPLGTGLREASRAITDDVLQLAAAPAQDVRRGLGGHREHL